MRWIKCKLFSIVGSHQSVGRVRSYWSYNRVSSLQPITEKSPCLRSNGSNGGFGNNRGPRLGHLYIKPTSKAYTYQTYKSLVSAKSGTSR